MNYITVTGGTKKQRDMAYFAAEFAISELLPRHRTLEVDIKLRKYSGDESWAAGHCSWADDNVNPREFEIECAKDQDEEDFIKTILHEMVHVKQYARGELKERYKNGYQNLWKGRDHSDTDYDDQPWEKEAYRLQETLYKKYIKSMN